MSKILYAADINNANLITLQNWVGAPLESMELVNDYKDLTNHHNKIVIVEAKEANYQIDVTKKIVANGNYLILLDLLEVCSFAQIGLCESIPEVEYFPRIVAGASDCVTSRDGVTIVDDLRSKDFNLDSFYFLTHNDDNVLKAVVYTMPEYFKTANKPFKFLYLNGRDRPHRAHLWQLLEQKNLLKSSLCSYLKFSIPGRESEHSEIKPTLLPREYDSPYLGIDSLPKMKGDERNWKVFKHDFWRRQWVDNHIVPAQYIDSYFTVVTESTVERMFPTEKTFKPLLAGHPFLILAAPGIYEYLHGLGFKTFDGIIDEGFAYEPNLDRKIEMLSAEIERLCNIDLEQFLEDVKPICEHNQRHYANGRQEFFLKKHLELQEFFKRVEQDACDFFNKTGRYSHGTV